MNLMMKIPNSDSFRMLHISQSELTRQNKNKKFVNFIYAGKSNEINPQLAILEGEMRKISKFSFFYSPYTSKLDLKKCLTQN